MNHCEAYEPLRSRCEAYIYLVDGDNFISCRNKRVFLVTFFHFGHLRTRRYCRVHMSVKLGKKNIVELKEVS